MITHSEPNSNKSRGYSVSGLAIYISVPGLEKAINLLPKFKGILLSLGFYCFCYKSSLSSASSMSLKYEDFVTC